MHRFLRNSDAQRPLRTPRIYWGTSAQLKRRNAAAVLVPMRDHSSLLRAIWPTLLARVPRGFEKFFQDTQSKKSGEHDGASPSGTEFPNGDKKEAKADKEQRNEKESEEEGAKNDEGDKPGRQGKKKPENPWPKFFNKLQYVAGFLFLVSWLYRRTGATPIQEVSFQEFKTMYLLPRKVHKLMCYDKQIVHVFLKKEGDDTQGQAVAVCQFRVGSIETLERQLEETQVDMQIPGRDFVPIQHVSQSTVASDLLALAPTIAITALWLFVMTKMNPGGNKMGGKSIFSIGKSPATLVKPGDKKVLFKDVAGLDEAKVEIMEFVDFLKHPARFTKLGAKVPKGALLVGPPGTGKTLLAKAVAGEASVPFYSISGSDFIEMFVGVGPARVRDLFNEARENAPCILFIDEIDAVGRARGKGGFGGGNDERENTLNQLLVEMDGFQSTEGIVVLAGTNRADILDKALLRPGRFDRQISIDKPDIRGRQQIFMIHLQKLLLKDKPEYISKRLAALTPGFAGADIANICNEAALIAARHTKDSVEFVDFEKAVDRVIGGLEKPNALMNAKEKILVAYHEAGHAVAGWFLEHADPLLKVTIVPRGNGALGFAQYLPKDVQLYQTEQLTDMICMILGGRVSEQLFFGKISTGASDDLQKVTKLAYGRVLAYGMSDRIGNVSYQASEGDSSFFKPYSESTSKVIDEEVRDLVQACYDRTMVLLMAHKDKVKALAEQLLATETVSHNIIVDILGPRAFGSDAYLEYVKNAQDTLHQPSAPIEAPTVDISVYCKSKYDADYHCTVSQVIISPSTVSLHFLHQGSTALGSLQSILESKLYASDSTMATPITPVRVISSSSSDTEHRGILEFDAFKFTAGQQYFFEACATGYSREACFVHELPPVLPTGRIVFADEQRDQQVVDAKVEDKKTDQNDGK